MGKKIIVLNGSPRIDGNTSGLIKAFTEGAEAAGNQVTAFHLDSMNISGCKGCFGGCGKEDSPCVQKDDMDKIYPVMKEADVVVMASPLYYWTISGQLKTAVDRLFALEEGGANILGKRDYCGVLLMAAEGNGFEDAVSYFDHLMEHMHWTNLGHVLADGVAQIGDIEGKPILEEARKLGASIK